jgi:hypothetical protein
MPRTRKIRALDGGLKDIHQTATSSRNRGAPGAAESATYPGWRQPLPPAYLLLVAIWFLYLFAPHKLLQYFLPGTRPLTWIPELLLWVCTILWLRDPTPKRGFPAYTRFMALFLFGTAVALVLGNSTLAFNVDRVMYEPYLLGLLTLTICDKPDRARPIFDLYFGYFLWFGIWGLISLKTSPIGAVEDTSTRVIVFWHRDYDNRDAFGPLMVAGFAYSIYYLQANRAIRTRVQTVCGYLSMGMCFIGFITSFGRGAFIAFLAVGGHIYAAYRGRPSLAERATSRRPLCGHHAKHYAGRYAQRDRG